MAGFDFSDPRNDPSIRSASLTVPRAYAPPPIEEVALIQDRRKRYPPAPPRQPTNSYQPPADTGPVFTNPVNPGSTVHPASPTGTAGPTAELDRLRQERLEAALAAIGANFDVQRGDYGRQLEELRALFENEQFDLNRQYEDNTEAIGDNAAERGILHSGIYAKNLARNSGDFARANANLLAQLNPVEGAEGFRIRDIMSAINLLGQQQASAEAAAKLEAEQSELDIDQLLALFGTGLSV